MKKTGLNPKTETRQQEFRCHQVWRKGAQIRCSTGSTAPAAP